MSSGTVTKTSDFYTMGKRKHHEAFVPHGTGLEHGRCHFFIRGLAPIFAGHFSRFVRPGDRYLNVTGSWNLFPSLTTFGCSYLDDVAIVCGNAA